MDQVNILLAHGPAIDLALRQILERLLNRISTEGASENHAKQPENEHAAEQLPAGAELGE